MKRLRKLLKGFEKSDEKNDPEKESPVETETQSDSSKSQSEETDVICTETDAQENAGSIDFTIKETEMPYAWIDFVNPGERPDNSLPQPPNQIWPSPPGSPPQINYPLFPTQPIYIPGMGWVKPPTFPNPPIYIPSPPPPQIWNPAFPSVPIYIPDRGWINMPTFPTVPIVIPPAPPAGVTIPKFPTNPIVIPPMPIVEIPEGQVLVVVVSSDGAAKWGLVNPSAVVTPPIYGTTPTPK